MKIRLFFCCTGILVEISPWFPIGRMFAAEAKEVYSFASVLSDVLAGGVSVDVDLCPHCLAHLRLAQLVKYITLQPCVLYLIAGSQKSPSTIVKGQYGT